MRKIKLFPAPRTELRLDVSDEMGRGYQECQRMAQSWDDGKDCDIYSQRTVAIGDTGLCGWSEIIRQVDKGLMKEPGDAGYSQNQNLEEER